MRKVFKFMECLYPAARSDGSATTAAGASPGTRKQSNARTDDQAGRCLAVAPAKSGATGELGGKPPHLPGRTHVHVHSKDPSTACGDANDALTAPASPPIPSARVTSLSRAQSDSTTVASERILEAPAATTSRTADASEQGLLASGRAPACGGGSSSSSPASSDAVAAAGSSTWALDVTSRGTQQPSTRAAASAAAPAAALADTQHCKLVEESGLSPTHAAFAEWRLVKAIGHGAFSKVFLATRWGAAAGGDGEGACVLKVVNLGSECTIREDYKPILRSEGQFLQHFEQPGFVKCHQAWGGVMEPGADAEPDNLVLALEHLTGGMLLDRLKQGPMSEAHAAAAFYQILTCILFMHHDGYLHRDLKPDNVMLARRWCPEANADEPPPVRLIDLGMVLHFTHQPNETGLMGSPGYMSPEAIRGHRHTPQMDMYSLGVLLFVMLTGCKPIPSAICARLTYDTLPTAEYPGMKMSQFRRCSPAARDLVIALMQRRPGDRPNALNALGHAWLQSHAHAWRERGHDLAYLAIRENSLRAVLTRAPSADMLLVKARAEHPLPPSSRHEGAPQSQASSAAPAAPASRRGGHVRRAAEMPGSVPVPGAKERYARQVTPPKAAPALSRRLSLTGGGLRAPAAPGDVSAAPQGAADAAPPRQHPAAKRPQLLHTQPQQPAQAAQAAQSAPLAPPRQNGLEHPDQENIKPVSRLNGRKRGDAAPAVGRPADAKLKPADVTCWAVPVKPLPTVGKSCPLHVDEREHLAPVAGMPGALSDTFDNILGLVKRGDAAPARGDSNRHGRPPSAKCINKALQAVMVAAEETAAEKKRTSALCPPRKADATPAAPHSSSPNELSPSSACNPTPLPSACGEAAVAVLAPPLRRCHVSNVSELSETAAVATAAGNALSRRTSVSTTLGAGRSACWA